MSQILFEVSSENLRHAYNPEDVSLQKLCIFCRDSLCLLKKNYIKIYFYSLFSTALHPTRAHCDMKSFCSATVQISGAMSKLVKAFECERKVGLENYLILQD